MVEVPPLRLAFGIEETLTKIPSLKCSVVEFVFLVIKKAKNKSIKTFSDFPIYEILK